MPTALSLTALAGRLDKGLAELAPQLSRARLQQLIKEGQLSVDGAAVTKASLILKGGEALVLTIPEAVPATPRARAIPLDIVFEDKHLLVLNKQAGLVVHPAAGHEDDTLVNALLAYCGDSLSGIGGERRPGIVHRLDKDTSGLMVVAKSDDAHKGLAAQFEGHKLSRRYKAFAWGLPKTAGGTIDGAIGRSGTNRQKMAMVRPKNIKDIEGNFYGFRDEKKQTQRSGTGKDAITHYTVEEVFGSVAALFTCELETGRTHQIRVHLTSIGHSIIGDPLYGKASGMRQHAAIKKLTEAKRELILDFPRQALHAAELRFTHPISGKAMSFEARLPADMKQLEKALRAIG